MEEESKEPLFSPFWVFMIKLAVGMTIGAFIGSLAGRISTMF